MVNIALFRTSRGQIAPKTNAINNAGAEAYRPSKEEQLAQLVITGCFNQTFYVSGDDQLQQIIELSQHVSDEFLAQLAVYARQEGFMKDTPALLMALLSTRNTVLLTSTFNKVIDNGKMIRNFVQIMRSGVIGRKSLGSASKRLVQKWLENRKSFQLLNDSVGNQPSLSDVIKMVHPKPGSQQQEAMYGYIMGRDISKEALPKIFLDYEAFKRGDSLSVPNVSFQLLTSLSLSKDDWKRIAENAGWQMTRMNLNTFLRHGVFNDNALVSLIADRLSNPELIRKAKAFPYQLMMAYYQLNDDAPVKIKNALNDAMEVALENVPKIKGEVHIMVDTSGSMHSSVTGYRQGSTSAVRCIDVAALFGSAFLSNNREAHVWGFDTSVYKNKVQANDSVLTNAKRLAALGGGGTDCSLPLAELNKKKVCSDVVIYFSDNESWADRQWAGQGTTMMKEWQVFKVRNPKAKLILIDLQPYCTSPAKSDHDILNIGGFSDQVFKLIAHFCQNEQKHDYWTQHIRSMDISIAKHID